MPAGRVSHANRGKALELAVEQANAQYLAHGIAVVQKVAVPTKLVRGRRHDDPQELVREKSTVDYIGTWQGTPIAFDAKETRERSLPLANIHEHQSRFLQNWEASGGRAFLLIYYGPDSAVYLMPLVVLVEAWQTHRAGGPASIPGDVIKRLPKVRAGRGCSTDYLAALDEWLRSASVSGGLA